MKNLYKPFQTTVLISFLLIFLPINTLALTYNSPLPYNSIIGDIYQVKSKHRDTLYKIARHYEIGLSEVASANPHTAINKKIPVNTEIIIPSFFVLPDSPPEGIVINLPEMRLYYYSPYGDKIITEPVAIGKPGWRTPVIKTKIIEKIINPEWIVPKSIADHYQNKNISLPKIFRPGIHNPLGQYALRLATFSLLIHGTNEPISIGQAFSSGCIRMYPEDIVHLFRAAEKNTLVTIIDQPYKFGWLNDRLYLEVHKPLETYKKEKIKEEVYQSIDNYLENNLIQHVDWNTVELVLKNYSGIPKLIGIKLK
jgi:L,D-transpeptidase ErfK/SrfK